jgi:anti-sigma factor RsiW
MRISDETLWRYVDGELPDEEAGAIENEARASEELLRRIEHLRSLKREILADAPEPPAGFPERVAELAARGTGVPVLALDEARRMLRRALVAAALLAAVGLAFLVFKVVPDWIEPSGLQAQDPLLSGGR